MGNEDLQKIYQTVFSTSARKFFTFIPHESFLVMAGMEDWNGLEVLDIGCGEGELASTIASLGAKKVVAIDYSAAAIATCKKRYNGDNLEFRHCAYQEVGGQFDAVVMGGVLEHFNDPFGELQSIIEKNLREKGVVISSSPGFLNLRGSIWMTLQLLFKVPMSLTDLHFIYPCDFEDFCKKYSYNLEYKSVEQNWGNGEKIIMDFAKRLPKALQDVGLEGNVEALLNWVKKVLRYQEINNNSGAIIIYKVTK